MTRTAALSLAALLLAAACQKQTPPSPEPAEREESPAPPPPPGQQDAEVEIQTVPVAGNVSMLIGRGGNIGVSAGADGKILIDDQFAPLAPRIRAAADALEAGPIAFVINTHWHGDHTGGNPVFGRDATIIAHTNVRERLSTTQSARGRVVEPLPAEGLPDITFNQSLTLHFNGEPIDIIHLPAGHTDGDSAVYFRESNVVHTGDQFFHGRFPYVDLASGGDVESYADNVATILELIPADARVIPGHGALATVADLKAFHQMLTETIGIVRARMHAGDSLAKIQKRGLGKEFASFGGGFIDENTWIETIYQSLSRSK